MSASLLIKFLEYQELTIQRKRCHSSNCSNLYLELLKLTWFVGWNSARYQLRLELLGPNYVLLRAHQGGTSCKTLRYQTPANLHLFVPWQILNLAGCLLLEFHLISLFTCSRMRSIDGGTKRPRRIQSDDVTSSTKLESERSPLFIVGESCGS